MSQRVLALPAPGDKTQTETVNKNNKNTQLATVAKTKQLTGSPSFSGSAPRLGVGNDSTYQTPSVGHRRIDQMLREHNMEMRRLQGSPGRLWGLRMQLHQNLENYEQERSNAANQARSASKKARSDPATTKREQALLDEKARNAKKKHLQTVSAVEKAQSLVGKRERDSPSGKTAPKLKRSKSTENPLATTSASASRKGPNQKQQKIFPQIFPVKTEVNHLREKAELEKKIKLMGERLERQAALIEEFQKTQRSNSNSETVPITKKNTAEINRLRRQLKALQNTHISPGKVEKMREQLSEYQTRIAELTKPKNNVKRALFKSNNENESTGGSKKENKPTGGSNNTNKPTANPPKTPGKQGIPKRTTAPSQTGKHRDAKKQGAEERAKERRKRWKEEGAPAVKRALEPMFNQIAKQKNTPPGITKTNIERLLQPFKQPVTVTVAPTISVKGGSGGSLKQTQIQYKSPVDKKKKKPLKFTRGPATARKQESAKFRNAIISKLRSPVAAKRREALYSLRTPTTGQRKKHVIELIDRVLRRMKVRADVEKKLIKFYESLSERHIKQLFGGRTKEEVKTILKKQVDYFSKKR
jgi:hypothetical protein